MKRSFGLLVSTVMGLTVGCKPASNESEVMHTFGNTMGTRTAPPANCQIEMQEAKKKHRVLPKSTAYLTNLLNYIIDENNKSINTFSGMADKSRFCIAAIESDWM